MVASRKLKTYMWYARAFGDHAITQQIGLFATPSGLMAMATGRRCREGDDRLKKELSQTALETDIDFDENLL